MSGWMVSSWRSCARLPATGWLILGVSVLVALSSAFTVPVMSYFIVDGLQALPYCISLFSISSALCGVWYSQWLGHKTDQGWPIKRALLLALAEERDIILLDEWAADQDPHFRREFYQVLLPLMQEMGKTIFAISHDDHYFIHADRLLEMRNGQLSELTGEERDAASRDAVARTA